MVDNSGSKWLLNQLGYINQNPRLKAKNKKRVSPLGMQVANLLGEWKHGLYHLLDYVNLKKIDWNSDLWIELTLHYPAMSTYDGSDLTTLVFLAHDYCLRLQIEAVSYRYLRLVFHPRTRTNESGNNVSKYHPSLEEALARYRKWQPLNTGKAELIKACTFGVFESDLDECCVRTLQRLDYYGPVELGEHIYCFECGTMLTYEEIDGERGWADMGFE